MNKLIALCGAYLILEAIISLYWTRNDKWIGSQLIRVTRIIVGIFILWVAYRLEVGSILYSPFF
jgi:hypothetical protein